jgi:malonyl CoA-acyl carrier protein transacylase
MPVSLLEPAPSAAATAWDTRLVLLSAPDRAALAEAARDLAARADAQPLAHLGALNAAQEHTGVRLAVVASSEADLRAKLTRAAERLADPKTKQVRDSNGIYYFSEPLGAQGTVALLFPGEGAQYLNMLADLCAAFPEVEDTFAWCDRLAAEAGKPEASLRRVLHLPPGASEAERAAAEAELRGLGPSIFGVLLADQAIYRLLTNLRVPVSAIAGHSAGELGALLASGAMDSHEVFGGRLVEIMEVMQSQEAAAGGPDVALLAVGAGKETVDEVAAAVAGGAVVVAMDNCPHQCVAVGPTHLLAAVESALAERGTIAERLPFNRPYHTPLFEPYMGAFRDLFASVPFQPPHTPVYCCSTGAPFPTDPDATRELCVNQWVRPVGFTGMIRRMHDDGVRLFVECGPRGNLSAFVEDILRGRQFAALPANLPRKSGPTQINHMVAQLFAHGVDVNAAHLYAQPTPPAPLSEGRGEKEFIESHRSHEARDSFSPLPFREGGPGGVGEAVTAYLDVMEQFLDAQREVLTAFFAGPPPAVDFARFLTEPAAPEARPEAPFCLMQTVTHHVPGQEIVFRRVLDEREDLYADDHTLGGRGVSRTDPTQNGLPVLPMTFSLEAMSEAASALVPGKVVTAIRNVRLFRWLPFDPEPTTLEVRAHVSRVDAETGVVEVTANVRDLGNSFLADGTNKPACEATVFLADAYPEPPAARAFDLTDELPCVSTVQDLRNNMFHGPLFQMIRSLIRAGREGIEGTLEVQAREGWFRSNPDPRFAIDPVLTDAAMHILGAWHLEQPDWSGRILLPIGVTAVEFFGPPPPVGSHVLVRGHNEHEDARQCRHGLEVFDTAGRVALRLTGAGYWRFYLPFDEVNFFGPKDQYFLSARVPAAEPVAGARCYFLEPPQDLQQPVLRASGVRVTMTRREIAEYTAWTGTEAERNDWFFTRLVAKDAVRSAYNAVHGGGTFPSDIEAHVSAGRLVCEHRGEEGAPFPAVRVAHTGGKVAAVAAFAEKLGLGVAALPKNASPEDERAARDGAVRAALADALGVPAEACEVESQTADGAVVSANRSRYRVAVAVHKGAVVATTVCEGA